MVILTQAVLFSIFIFGLLFCFIINLLQTKTVKISDTENSRLSLSSGLVFSLNFARKLKPLLNSLLKPFPEERGGKSQSVFFSQKARTELEKLRQFVLDFIDFAELDTGLLPQEVVDMKEILNETLKELKTHNQRPDNLLQDIQCSDSCKVKGSSLHLKKCFEKILVNSFEAVKNEEKPVVQIYCFKQKGWVSIQFLDNGHGIEEEDKRKLFEPFFSKRFGLRGLGLSYVQKIIQAHGGEIRIERENSWTKALIKFPLVDTYYDRFDFLKLLKNRKKAA